MRPLPALAVVSAIVTLATATACAATGNAGNPCNLLSEPAVRQLTGVNAGHYTARATAAGICVYTFPGADTPTRDEYGNALPAPALTLELHKLPTDTIAHNLLQQRGSTDDVFGDFFRSTDALLTGDPRSDEIGDLERPEGDPEAHEYITLRGATARHNSTVAIIGMNDGTIWQPGTQRLLQRTVLTLAGAHIVAPVRTDLCAQFPVRTLQTLISITPSTARQTAHDFTGNTNSCSWQVVSDASSMHPNARPATIELTVQQFLNPAAALAQFLEDAGSQSDVRPIPRVADPADKAFSHRGKSPEAEALHGVFLAHWKLDGAEPEATAVPSYGGRMESLALTAAGAGLPPDPSIPPPTEAPQRTGSYAVQHGIATLWSAVNTGTITLLVLGFFAFRWFRRQRLKTTGLPATALITAIADTGVTVNNDPRVRLEMTVTPQSGPPYNTHYTTTVSRLNVANLVGQTVNVRIDPNDPERIVMV